MGPVAQMGVAGYILFWFVTLLAGGIFINRAYQLIRYLSIGKGGVSAAGIVKRMAAAAGHFVLQICQFKNLSSKDRASIGHVFMAWGFLTFVFYYTVFIVIGAGFGIEKQIEENSFYVLYNWLMDFAAPFIFVGAAWGIIRRYIIRPARLKGEQTWEALIILLTVLIHPFTHVFKIGTAIALGDPPAGLGVALPPISNWAAQLFTVANANAWHIFFFWAHWGFVLLVLGIMGYTRYIHLPISPFNVLLRQAPPKGAMVTVNVEEAMEKGETIGANKITDFTWKALLDTLACVSCGRCQDACPAYASEKPLNPKEIMQGLKKQLMFEAPQILKAKKVAVVAGPGAETAPAFETKAIIGNTFSEDFIWSCTTCRNCMEVCPMSNEHLPKMFDFRRNQILEQAKAPELLAAALDSIEKRGHPWRGTTSTRTTWSEPLGVKEMSADADVDVLYWVGCTSALDDRCQKVAVSMAKIFKTAGVKFGILGTEESCCGDPARRSGNEYLYQMQAQKNIELFKKYNVKKIVSACPHCFNTIKNEYPQFSGNFEVVHHSEFIADLLAKGKLKLKGGSGNVTFHDPCYAGRYNDLYKEPRQVLSAAGMKLTEMERSQRNALCCGGGGGRSWIEESGIKISNLRAEHAIKTGANILGAACPFCVIMFEDAVKAKGAEDNLKVKDIAEVIAAQLE